jgi:hypothetical protein
MGRSTLPQPPRQTRSWLKPISPLVGDVVGGAGKMWSHRSCETAPLVTAPVQDDVSAPDLARPVGRAPDAGIRTGDHLLVRGHHRRPGVPWFRAHPEVAAAVVAASSLGVLGLQVIDSRASDAIALLYVLPIGLAAVTFGLVGGLVSAAGGYLAFGLFALTSSADHVGPDGWVTRAAALLLLGGLLGRACDQAARAGRVALAHQRQRMSLEVQNRRYSDGIELSDSILQHIAAAKWRIEQ